MQKFNNPNPLSGAINGKVPDKGFRVSAFTLVELIVVITILAILATIGFVSFSGYLAGTRDTNRVAQLKSMSDALELYRTKKDLPIPDDKVDIKVGTGSDEKVIAYQGYIGKNVLETIEYTESGLDPKYKQYFSYYLTKDKKYFQLLAFLEEESDDTLAIKAPDKGVGVNKTFAGDYTDKYPHVQGKKLGILLDTENNPIQEVASVTGSGYLNIAYTNDEYKAIISNNYNFSGTGSKLAVLGNQSKIGLLLGSCKQILEKKNSLKQKDGTYLINPDGKQVFPVYCDMTTDGGGWTLYTAKAKYGFPDTGYVQPNEILNNTNYNEILWQYVSPGGKQLPFIYKINNQEEGRMILSSGHYINNDIWTNNIKHYDDSDEFSNAIKIASEGNTSGVTTNQIRTAIKADNKNYFTARINSGSNHIDMGTAFRTWSNLNSYFYFPSSPYNGTYRIGSETFSHISNTSHWDDGRSISIFIK